jgi:hypothetical protein
MPKKAKPKYPRITYEQSCEGVVPPADKYRLIQKERNVFSVQKQRKNSMGEFYWEDHSFDLSISEKVELDKTIAHGTNSIVLAFLLSKFDPE